MYDLKTFKEVFDPVLDKFINSKIEDYIKKTDDPFVKDFVNYSKNLITGGGKRLRPYIAYLAYKSFGGKKDNHAINFFISLELFHNFLLMHDDITDKGKTRHGYKTIHNYVLEKLNENERVGDLKHISDSQAMYIGDLLFSWSMEFFTDTENKNFKPNSLNKAKKYFYRTVDEVILGQMIDVDLSTRNNPGWDLIKEKTMLKTSRYSFVRPMQIGAILADPEYGMDEFFENLGTKLGIAFQIQDDLLDIVGNHSNTGKNPLIDIAEHQRTFFTNHIFANGNQDQIRFLIDILGKEVTKNKESKIQEFFYKTGAIDAGKKFIDKNLKDAKEIIRRSHLKNIYKQKFLALIAIIEERKS